MDASTLTVVIEIPGGSRNKYELDHQTGQIVYEDGETTFYIYKSINDVEPSETITID